MSPIGQIHLISPINPNQLKKIKQVNQVGQESGSNRKDAKVEQSYTMKVMRQKRRHPKVRSAGKQKKGELASAQGAAASCGGAAL